MNTDGVGVVTGLCKCSKCGKIEQRSPTYDSFSQKMVRVCHPCGCIMDVVCTTREIYQTCGLVYDEVAA